MTPWSRGASWPGVPGGSAIGHRIVAAGFLAVCVLLLAPGIGGAAGADPLVKSGPVSLGSGACSSAHMEATVRLSTSVLARGQQLAVTASIRDLGATSCVVNGGLASMRLQPVGPCGIMSLLIENAKGKDVWPGGATYHCFAEKAMPLAPRGASVEARGDWLGIVWDAATNSDGPAPAGRYRVVVGGHIVFSITLR